MSTLIEHPLVTEKAMDLMDFENKLVFIVNIDATKPDIREEVEQRFDVGVANVNTMITMKGTQKAIVKLDEDSDAQDVASRIGVF